jgi:hypothetical protein
VTGAIAVVVVFVCTASASAIVPEGLSLHASDAERWVGRIGTGNNGLKARKSTGLAARIGEGVSLLPLLRFLQEMKLN